MALDGLNGHVNKGRMIAGLSVRSSFDNNDVRDCLEKAIEGYRGAFGYRL